MFCHNGFNEVVLVSYGITLKYVINPICPVSRCNYYYYIDRHVFEKIDKSLSPERFHSVLLGFC